MSHHGPATQRGGALSDPVWEAASSAPLEEEDPEERRAVEAAKQARSSPVSAQEVSAQIAERLRIAR